MAGDVWPFRRQLLQVAKSTSPAMGMKDVQRLNLQLGIKLENCAQVITQHPLLAQRAQGRAVVVSPLVEDHGVETIGRVASSAGGGIRHGTLCRIVKPILVRQQQMRIGHWHTHADVN